MDKNAAEELRKAMGTTHVDNVDERNADFTLFDVDGRRTVRVRPGTEAHKQLGAAVKRRLGFGAFDAGGIYPLSTLARHADALEEQLQAADALGGEGSEALVALWAAVKAHRERSREEFGERLALGTLEFDDLPAYYEVGREVFFGTGDTMVGGPVSKTGLWHTPFGGCFLAVAVDVIANVDGKVTKTTVECHVAEFADLTPVGDLPVRPLVPGSAEMERLVARGRRFAALLSGPAYVAYEGSLVRPNWFGETTYRADGRVMVDGATFSRVDSDQVNSCKRRIWGNRRLTSEDYDDVGDDSEAGTVEEGQLHMTLPWVFGFSFRAKTWGTMLVAGLSDIRYAEGAYERLVLDDRTKKRVRALVQHSTGGFGDIIDGKGGGCIFLLHGEPGQGKSQPLDAVVRTPDGPRLMGDLNVGDKVFAADGTAVSILAVYPQGVRPTFELTFQDGRTVRADENHLWKVKLKGPSVRDPKRVAHFDLATTARLFDRLSKNASPIHVPLAKPCETVEADVPVDPWLLGFLLGDGFFKDKHCSFSTADPELVDRVRNLLPAGYDINHLGRYDYRIRMVERAGNARHELKRSLEELGLYGCGSHERFIPEAYLTGSSEQRFAIVRGLMDSDGYVGKDKTLRFTSTSKRLAKGFQQLIWSLGGIASISQKVGSYKKAGVDQQCRVAYSVHVRHPDPASLVSLPRKQDRLSGHHQYADGLSLRITKIERIADQPTQCVLVDHPDHLYLTEDWIVTHNTLTAETVAEHLRRPLYSISVGELGTDPDQLEERLREILDLASVWNAVLLLDEADIFMEARDEKDVLRNAMVGVFLRLLEYHQGVLFLTTNRVRNIDPAFLSRISVGIFFGSADVQKRTKVWTNLLSAAGIQLAASEVEALAKRHAINGRQMKNAIRGALTMAKDDGVPVTFRHIEEEVEETVAFEAGIRALSTSGQDAAPAMDAGAAITA